MRIARFVSYLDGLGVKLKVDGEQLRCRAPKGVLTDTLWQQIGERKSEILTFLCNHSTASARIRPYARNKALPLSFSQQRLWFLNQLEEHSATYNEHWAVRLIGPLQIGALNKSVTALVDRHEILRTSFPVQDGEPFQKIWPIPRPSADALIMPLPVVALQERSEREQAAEIQSISTSETEQPFNLEDGPLWRMKLLRLAEQEHVLLLTMHHIICDAWSMEVIMRDLSTFYDAFCEGATPQRAASLLPPLAIQYADFAIWQRERSSEWPKQLSYWQKQLAGAPPLLPLPTDYPRPAIQRFRGSSQSVSLPQELVAQLQQVSAKSGATLFMTLLAAFKVLLYRYSGTSDLLVGSPITNRVRSEIEPLIGFFANMVVLRTTLSGEASFLQILDRVRQVALDAYKHQEVPFEKVVEALQPERSLSHNPLFNVMFVLQNAAGQSKPKERQPERFRTATEGGAQRALTMTLLEMEQLTARFDLTLSIEATADEAGLIARWEYSTDLFEHETITRMSAHFQTLLTGLVANPETPIAALPLLTEAERHQLLVQWNDTATDYPDDKCIHQLFEEQVERTPEAIAVVFGHQQLTYHELNTRANQLAHYLIAQGVGANMLVGICIERSIEMVVGLLGILKAGGAYVPLDPSLPSERLTFMCQDAQIALLLTQQALRWMPGYQLSRLDLDADWPSIAPERGQNPNHRVTLNDLAYCIYTSGSTGKPKGVINSHRGIHNRLLWMQEAYGLTSSDRILQKTPFGFDVSVWEFFWPLMFGATLVVARPEGHKDPSYLVNLIEQEQITTLHFVPSMLQAFLQAEELERCHSLKRVICSGEALPYDLMQRFFGQLNAELHNLYGPTEAAIDVSFWACTNKSQREVVPIGRPVANTQLYILDSQLQPVPIGVAGELHIGGVQVARGYLNRPQLNQEKFIPNPFGPGKLYKTGDLCRYITSAGSAHGDACADAGSIEFVGRADYQVKIRGFRIELGEIEANLLQCPGVREAVVIVHEHKSGKQLVAYVILENKTENKFEIMRSQLRQKLPDYMIPSLFVRLDTMPLTPNGKINRRALPAPEMEIDSAQLVLPSTPTEEILAAIWQEVLTLKEVGIHHNFFEIGGHSLLATQVVSHIRRRLQVELPLRHLWIKPTIAELAQQIEKIKVSQAVQQVVKARITKREEITI